MGILEGVVIFCIIVMISWCLKFDVEILIDRGFFVIDEVFCWCVWLGIWEDGLWWEEEVLIVEWRRWSILFCKVSCFVWIVESSLLVSVVLSDDIKGWEIFLWDIIICKRERVVFCIWSIRGEVFLFICGFVFVLMNLLNMRRWFIYL